MTQEVPPVAAEASPWHTRDGVDVEAGDAFAPKFDADGLIPCIAQHADSGRVLMFAFMNAESLAATIRTGQVHYWSRSRGKLWKKGESSGMVQQLVDLRTDCDQDVVLATVRVGDDPEQVPQAACHTGYASCFYRAVEADGGTLRQVDAEKAFDPDAVYG
jgi:phosphoribosyl-AMP cyclohydrolase